MSAPDRMLAYYEGEMARRAGKELAPERVHARNVFIEHCRRLGARSVLEVGCGAARDGVSLADHFTYAGVDRTAAAVAICRDRGLNAVLGDAAALPFAECAFDSAWTMSTLMHLSADRFGKALAEIARVTRPGGTLGIGIWGAQTTRAQEDEHGRYFHTRSDEDLAAALTRIGEIVLFETWKDVDDGWHYQFAIVRNSQQ